MYHTIVVPVGPTDGTCAVRHATTLARYLGGRVVLVSVVTEAGRVPAANGRLDDLARLGRRPPETEVRVAQGGGAAQAYAAVIREVRAELVILDAHSDLLAELPCLTGVPVLLVPSGEAPSVAARWLAAGR